MTFKYTDLGPGDLGDLGDLGGPTQYLAEEDDDLTFISKVWDHLVTHSSEIDKFILAYRDKPNIGYHNWAGVIQEIAAAVDKAPD